jgi:Concanavalin A-like lectin/glucanases superfamily
VTAASVVGRVALRLLAECPRGSAIRPGRLWAVLLLTAAAAACASGSARNDGSLEGSWRLQTVDGRALSAGDSLTWEFTSASVVATSPSCLVRADYTTTAGMLTLRAVSSQEGRCSSSGSGVATSEAVTSGLPCLVGAFLPYDATADTLTVTVPGIESVPTADGGTSCDPAVANRDAGATGAGAKLVFRRETSTSGDAGSTSDGGERDGGALDGGAPDAGPTPDGGAGSGIPTLGLLAYYPFTGNARDASGNGHDGTVYGPVLVADRFGNAGDAYEFDGSNDYIEVPDAPAFHSLNAVSLSAWFKPYSPMGSGAWAKLVGKHYESYAGSFLLWWQANYVCFGMPYIKVLYSGDLFDGKWHHAVGTYDGANVLLYVDGVVVAQAPATGSIQETNYPITMGRRESRADYFNGVIDDVLIYSRGLSSDEVLQLYHQGGW